VCERYSKSVAVWKGKGRWNGQLRVHLCDWEMVSRISRAKKERAITLTSKFGRGLLVGARGCQKEASSGGKPNIVYFGTCRKAAQGLVREGAGS